MKRSHRSLICGSAFFSCLITFFAGAFTPVPGQAAALISPVAFDMGFIPVQTSGGAIIICGIPHPDGLGSLPVRFVAFLACWTPITHDCVVVLLYAARLVGAGCPTFAGGGLICLVRMRILGHVHHHPQRVSTAAPESVEVLA